MASLSFTLLPDALLELHDVLICLSKFNESVSIEAEHGFVRHLIPETLAILPSFNPAMTWHYSSKPYYQSVEQCSWYLFEQLRLSALNPTKSGYAAFRFGSTTFFSDYKFSPRSGSSSSARSGGEKFSCQIYIKVPGVSPLLWFSDLTSLPR